MKKEKQSLFNFFRSEDGATAIEYAIIASVMALVLAAAGPVLGAKLRTLYTNVAANMP